jgi:integrase/recombinase XerD
VRSRNIRLSAIRSFFRLVALRDPDSIGIATRVLAIPTKREDKKLIGYLTRAEIQALLNAPDRSRWTGRRDHALLLTLYNSGARVSEITTFTRDQVCFGAHCLLQLYGKGRKERTVPLWPETRQVLKAWLSELGEKANNGVAFPNARGKPLSRDGVDYVLKQAILRASPSCPSLAAKRITPHVIRHSTALHLLQASVDIATIALWLGHESIETTHLYLETDLSLKEKALAKLDPVETGLVRFKADDPLLAFLAAL